jgi:tetratricopeptide (TPR) repeat protein
MVWLEKAKNAADSATRMHLPTISQSDRATIANNLGIAFERRGEMKSALECYNLSASIYKDSVLLLISRIRYYFNTNHFEELLTDCEHALALNPTDPEMLSDLHTFKGYAKHCLKKHSEGMIDLEKATIAQPQNYFSFMVKAHIQLVNNEPALATLDQGISSCDSREGLEKLFSMKDRHFTLSDRERNISLAVKTGVLSRIS